MGTGISIAFQPKQRELYKLYEEGESGVVGYGGSRGGAKSHCGRQVMILRRLKYKETDCFIIRKTLDDLRDNHIRPFMREYPFLEKYYHKQEKIVSLPNGSNMRFISADDYDDIFKLYGKEAADIFVDQAEQFTQEQLEFLATVNRCTTNLLITPKMLWTFNPGNVGHTYLKRVFVDRDYQKHESGENFAFIRAYGWDNVEWCRKPLIHDRLKVKDYYSWDDATRKKYFVERSDYGKKLNALPESQKKAQLDGDFDIFEGQFFSMFRRDIHVIPSIKPEIGYRLMGTIDYGGRSVMEVQFRDYEGNVVNFLEVYTESQTPTERFEAMAKALVENEIYGLELQYDTNMDLNLKYYAVTDGRTPADVAREVFAEVFRVAGLKGKEPDLHVVSKRSEDRRGYRVICNEAMKEAMLWVKDEAGGFIRRPKFYITKNCPHLIKEVAELISDSSSADGLDFMQDMPDDAYDACKMTFVGITQSKREPIKSEMTEEEYFQKVVSERVLKRAIGGDGRLL